MTLLRTPEQRFDNLPGYSFDPHYVEIDSMRIHYVDEGENAQETVLMLHGEPSWSYLYRKMIPIVKDAGFRAIAPDLPGFGRSDKPSEKSDYSYQKFVDWMKAWLLELDLKNITLVCQDWGGLIGLRLAAELPERFSRISAANTFLPTGQGKPNPAFQAWQKFSQESPKFEIGRIIQNATVSTLSDEVVAAYDAPFPDDSYKAGARIFPSLVPTSPEDPAIPANLKAWEVYKAWEKPFHTAFSDSDPITKGGDTYFQKVIPGTQGQKHITIEQGGHFLQEDKGEVWAEAIVQFIQDNPA